MYLQNQYVGTHLGLILEMFSVVGVCLLEKADICAISIPDFTTKIRLVTTNSKTSVKSANMELMH